MTAQKSIKETELFSTEKILQVMCWSILIVMILFSNQIRLGIYQGATIAVTNVLPTIFPFLILSDFWIYVYSGKTNRYIDNIFQKLFGISANALPAFVLGLLFGFPIGVKAAADLYAKKSLSKEETEKIIGVINNPSAAYTISGIGLGLYRSFKIGLILYFSVTISSILIAKFSRISGEKSKKTYQNSEQTFNIAHSIKNAGSNSIAILSYIVFFFAINSLVSAITRDDLISTCTSIFLEISGAVTRIINLQTVNQRIKLSLTAFALGFSGLSVHLQAFSFLPKEIRKSRYFKAKFTQGILSCFVTFLLCRQ